MQQGTRRRSEALLEAHPQAPSVCSMQFSTLQLAVPMLGWYKSLPGQARNQIREMILMEITWGVEIQAVRVEFSMWYTQLCLHSASGEQPAVKAAGSITWFQLCCYPASNHYPRIMFAKC